MGLKSYFNSKSMDSNLCDILSKYDTDNNGFTQSEFSSALKGITTIFAKNIIKLTRYDKKLFKELDTNSDKIVSYDEMAYYINKEYKLDFYSLMSLKLEDVCKEIDCASEYE